MVCVQAEGKWRKKSLFEKPRLAEDGTALVESTTKELAWS